MAKPFQVTISPAVANTTAFGNNVIGTYDGSSTVYIPTTSTTSDGLAHTIIITDVAAIDLSSYTLTIVGTNFNGEAQSETIAGPETLGNVSSNLYYLSLTSVSINMNNASNPFDFGINADAISPAYPIDWAKNQLEVNVSTEIMGFTLQYTRSPSYINSLPTSIQNVPSDEWIWIDWVATSTGVYQTLYSPVNIRFNFTDFTSGQTLTFCASQSRLT